jgi:hypothetical protein
MTARAMGEIPTVEPLLYSMYLKLPMIPGDYTEDTLSEPEPSEFIDNEPNLNFKPLVTSKGFSATMPRWDVNSDLKFDSVTSVEIEPQYDVTSDSRVNIETENTFNENSQEENDNIFQPVTEISEYPIAPQINRLEANVEFDSNTSISDSESQLHPDDFEFPTTRQSNNTENREIISKEIPKGDNNEPAVNSNNLNSEAEVLPNILPQVNHLEIASQSVEANVEVDLTTSTNESKLDSNDIEFPIDKQSIDSDDGETTMLKEISKGDNNEPAVNSSNLNGEAIILPNILPQVNHLQTASQSVEANVEFNFNTSTSESQSEQNMNDIGNINKPLHEQLTNTQNLPTQKAPEIDKLETSSVQNPSTDDTRNQQTQIDAVNKKNIIEKTVIPNLINDSQLTNQIKPSLKKRTLLPQINRVETTKSVKPDIQLDSTQLNLQSPLQQQRSISQGEKTQTEQSSPSQSNNNSQSQTSISSQQQSIEPNLHLRSNLVNHSNAEFVDKSSSSEQKPVIPLGEDSASLLPSSIVKTLSPIHPQTEFRRHQAEPHSPTIEVTIGRIEVRGIKPEPSPKSQGRKSTKKSPALSLSDYLKQRNGN